MQRQQLLRRRWPGFMPIHQTGNELNMIWRIVELNGLLGQKWIQAHLIAIHVFLEHGLSWYLGGYKTVTQSSTGTPIQVDLNSKV